MSADRTLKGQSRVNWSIGQNQDGANLDQIKAGALLRIADATEAMAKRQTELIYSRNYWERECKLARQRLDTEYRRTAALRGHIARMKRAAKTVGEA